MTYEFGLFYFRLSISGEKEASFQEVSGLTIGIENESLLPKGAKHSNLVLKRGFMTQDGLLSKWCEETLAAGLSAPISLHTLSLELMNEQGNTIMQWFFYDAWPVKWQVASIKDQQLLVETLEFSYSYFEKN